jgi:serine/threonine protein kinase
MGAVYKAEDPQLKRLVAIEVPRFKGTPEVRAQARQRFVREGRSAAAIRHPHVCPIHDVGEQDGWPYVVMAYIEGKSLDGKLKGIGRFADCRQAVALVLQVAQALEGRGIIHRDLKPANILLDAKGQAILTDFGLARDEADPQQLTVEGSLLGTPPYMTPEQVSPRFGTVSPQTDLYSLGVVLYQMVTGRLPFEGSTTSILAQVAAEEPPRPTQLRPDLDPALEQIITTAMARRP